MTKEALKAECRDCAGYIRENCGGPKNHGFCKTKGLPTFATERACDQYEDSEVTKRRNAYKDAAKVKGSTPMTKVAKTMLRPMFHCSDPCQYQSRCPHYEAGDKVVSKLGDGKAYYSCVYAGVHNICGHSQAYHAAFAKNVRDVILREQEAGRVPYGERSTGIATDKPTNPEKFESHRPDVLEMVEDGIATIERSIAKAQSQVLAEDETRSEAQIIKEMSDEDKKRASEGVLGRGSRGERDGCLTEDDDHEECDMEEVMLVLKAKVNGGACENDCPFLAIRLPGGFECRLFGPLGTGREVSVDYGPDGICLVGDGCPTRHDNCVASEKQEEL